MDIHQLKTFVMVAREQSITRASELLHLSQPAVSAHVKAIEEALGLTLFERTPKGMSLTPDGQRLLLKAEQTLASHRELMDEATRIKGHLTGKLRLGAGANSNHEAVGRLLTTLAERCPDIEVSLKHARSADVVAGLRNGSFDAGFYNEGGEPGADLATVEVSRFGICIVSPPGLVAVSDPPDWKALSAVTWIYPATSSCCGKTAERIFEEHRFRPRRIVDVDRPEVMRTLIAGGIGVGLLHSPAAKDACDRGEVELIFESRAEVRVLFAYAVSRAQDPLVNAAASIMRG